MENPSWADIRQSLETATVELRKVEGAWMEDADIVALAALSIDKNQRRHMRDPERLQELRKAIVTIEWLLDDVADAEAS
jgi:hypothetical protein